MLYSRLSGECRLALTADAHAIRIAATAVRTLHKSAARKQICNSSSYRCCRCCHKKPTWQAWLGLVRRQSACAAAAQADCRLTNPNQACQVGLL